MRDIIFYGTRGTSSHTANEYSEFGGATSCILINFGSTPILIDCGSGIYNALDDLKEYDELNVFITHFHLDHICGIPALFAAFENKKLHIWGKSFNGKTIKENLEKVMDSTLWPVKIDKYKNVQFHDFDGVIYVNDILVSRMNSNHPGGCSLFRFDYKNNSLVTAFDFCDSDGYDEKLIEFAKGAETLIYDGTNDINRQKKHADFGHSTPEKGCEIAEKIGVEKLYITHYGHYDDNYLSNWEEELKKKYSFVEFARSGQPKDALFKLVQLGNLLNESNDINTRLQMIVESCMDITNADGGTLYLVNKDQLEFQVLFNRSKGTKKVRRDESILLPSLNIEEGRNVCTAAVREKRLINIPDISNCKDYDFSGSLKYDELNSYHTQSVMVIPLMDQFNDVIGVLQVINALDSKGNILPFNKSYEETLFFIANYASNFIMMSKYHYDLTTFISGFVKSFSVAVDERTPYNAYHTKNMVKFAERFLNYEESINGRYKVNAFKRNEILMSIWLHDIGKVLTPLEIMNKDNRLGEYEKALNYRFERRELLLKLSFANKEITKEEYEYLENERLKQLELINYINRVDFLDNNLKEDVDNLYKETYKELDGSIRPVITEEEYKELSIVKGTLSIEERKIMEGHVTYTQKLLGAVKFPKHYESIPEYAGNHHEFMNGSGYPKGINETNLSWQCRLITICDIFEALTAKDRPYKKPIPVDKSIAILYSMAKDGKLDRDIIEHFEASKCWEDNN